MSIADGIFLFLLLLLGGWGVLAFVLRRQDVEFGPGGSEDQVFRCEECNYVYTDDADVGRSLCPECGRMNNSVQF